MKKLLFFFALAAVMLGGMARATTLTGTLKNPDGSAFNGTLNFTLSSSTTISGAGGCPGPIYVPNTYRVTVYVVNGAPVGSVNLYDSECMNPAGLAYNVQLVSSTGAFVSQQWVITGTTEDVGTIQPITQTGFVFSVPVVNQILCGSGMSGCGSGYGTVTLASSAAGAATPATSNLLKGNGTVNGVVSALPGTDYVIPSGTAAMATALAATPAQCTGSQFSQGIATNGNANCATPSGASLPPGYVGQTLANLGGASYGATFGNAFYAYPNVLEFGDSITNGIGCTVTSLCYAQLILADFSGNGANYGVSGEISGGVSIDMMADLNPQYTHNPAVTLMIGTNDLSGYGGNAGPYIANMTGMLTWATVPRIGKVFMTDAQCTQTGTWANSSSFNFPSGLMTSDTSGSTMTCTIVTYGPALYIGYAQDTSWTTGSMSVTVDGTSIGSSLVSVDGVAGVAGPYQYPAVRYAVAPGSHTVVFTEIHSSGTTTDTVAPAWLGSAYPISVVSPPRLFVADIPPQENNASASLIATYNSNLIALEGTLDTDGLPVVRVNETGGGPTSAGWLHAYNATTNPTDYQYQAANLPGGLSCPASGTPGYHPNNCGHAALRDAFEYYIRPAVLPPSNLIPTVTVAGNASSLDNLDVTNSYGGFNLGLSLRTALGGFSYTGIYTSNSSGGNYALMFQPSFNSNGPLVSMPYWGISSGAGNVNNNQNGVICEAPSTNKVLCSGGSGGASLNAAMTWTLYGGSIFDTGFLQLSTQAQPTCSSTTAGEFNYVEGNTTTKDTVMVCAHDASNAYAWRTIY